MTQNIPRKIIEVADYVMKYATETDDWLRVKKEFLSLLPTPMRKLFSRRHYSTRKHSLNDLEIRLINYWFTHTGRYLTIPPEKVHDPTWTRHRRGWGLKRYNKERKRNAEKREKKLAKAKQTKVKREKTA